MLLCSADGGKCRAECRWNIYTTGYYLPVAPVHTVQRLSREAVGWFRDIGRIRRASGRSHAFESEYQFASRRARTSAAAAALLFPIRLVDQHHDDLQLERGDL